MQQRNLLRGHGRQLQEIALYLGDDQWQVGPVEPQTGSRNPMVFDVGMDVFVMRMGAGKCWVGGVRPGVVPVEAMTVSFDLV